MWRCEPFLPNLNCLRFVWRWPEILSECVGKHRATLICKWGLVGKPECRDFQDQDWILSSLRKHGPVGRERHDSLGFTGSLHMWPSMMAGPGEPQPSFRGSPGLSLVLLSLGPTYSSDAGEKCSVVPQCYSPQATMSWIPGAIIHLFLGIFRSLSTVSCSSCSVLPMWAWWSSFSVQSYWRGYIGLDHQNQTKTKSA